MSDFDITKVKKLTRESLQNKEQPKITLEGLKRMCNFLDEENPATYEIFLKYRTDLGENEVAYYQDIIQTLKENIRLKQQIINETMGSYEYCFNVPPPSIIYDAKVNHIHNPC
jgi:hypothetical protein